MATRPGRRPPRPRRELVAFLGIGLVALLAVSAGAVLLSERIARATALAEAERTADRFARLLVAPALTDALTGVPGGFAELERDVMRRMSDGSIRSVVVWAADGEVLWASEPSLVGQVIEPTEGLRTAIGGRTVAEVDEAPETAAEGSSTGPLVEVYVPLTVDGRRLAVESYFDYGTVERQATLLRWQIVPLALGSLVLLQLVQIPIAASLARRVGRQETERAELMARTLTASDRERRAIAADVHDGPVQDLAGVSYALSALRPSVPADRQATVDRLVVTVRHAVQSLRRLMIDIYPPDLSGPGLGAAISDIAESLRARGLTVLVDAPPLPDVPPETAAVLYRTAKEALANVAAHAGAGSVWITLEEAEEQGRRAIRLEVADDGAGYPEGGTDRRSEGHLGLSLVRDRLADAGGSLALGARRGGGAVLTALLPLDHGQ